MSPAWTGRCGVFENGNAEFCLDADYTQNTIVTGNRVAFRSSSLVLGGVVFGVLLASMRRSKNAAEADTGTGARGIRRTVLLCEDALHDLAVNVRQPVV